MKSAPAGWLMVRCRSAVIGAVGVDPIDQRLNLVGGPRAGAVRRHLTEQAVGAEQRPDPLQRQDNVRAGAVALPPGTSVGTTGLMVMVGGSPCAPSGVDASQNDVPIAPRAHADEKSILNVFIQDPFTGSPRDGAAGGG